MNSRTIFIKVLQTIAIISLLVGCKPAPKTLTDEEKQFISEQEKVAYDGYIFGAQESDHTDYKGSISIMGTKYRIIPIYNENNELYRLLMISKEESLPKVQTALKLAYLDTYQVISTKYGTPTKNRSFPSRFYFGPTNLFNLSQWNVGDKTIEISIYQNNLNKYEIWLDIFSENMQKNVNEYRSDLFPKIGHLKCLKIDVFFIYK